MDFYGLRGLARDLNDDRLVASVLEFTGAHPNDRVILVADDRGLRLKAPHHGIEVKRLAESYRLPDEPDPDEQRIRSLEAELAITKGRRPKLSLTFAGARANVLVERPPDIRIDAAERDLLVERAAEEFREYYATQARHGVVLTSGLRRPGPSLSPSVIKHRFAEYSKLYSSYVNRLCAYRDLRTRSVELTFELHNDGTAPATHVDVWVKPTDRCSLSADGPSVEPSPPPVKGGDAVALGYGIAEMAKSLARPSAGWSVSGSEGHMLFQLDRLTHCQMQGLGVLFAVFSEPERIGPFGIEGVIGCAEDPGQVRTRLNVTMR